MLRAPESIKVETAPSFDRAWYRVQNAVKVLLTVIILAGLAGLFGGGFLSSTVVKVGPFEVTYERFARKTVPFRISVRAFNGSVSGPLRLTLDTPLPDKAAIIRTTPTASASRETKDGTEFVFDASGSQPKSLFPFSLIGPAFSLGG